MLTNNSSVRCFNRTGLVGEVTMEELAERTLSDKADTGAVFFLGVRKTDFFGNSAYFGLAHVSDREHGLRELVLIEAI